MSATRAGSLLAVEGARAFGGVLIADRVDQFRVDHGRVVHSGGVVRVLGGGLYG
jgi:hypothetical protein